MILESMRPALAAGIPLLAAVVILFFGNRVRPNVREAVTILAAVSMTCVIFSMIPQVLAGNQYQAKLWQLADGLSLSLRADAAGMVFACIASVLWILTSVYSIGYVRGHHEKNQTGYFSAFAVCLGSAAGIALASNLLTFLYFMKC